MPILIADDDHISTAMVSAALTRWGLTSVVAHDGGTAWALVAADPRPTLAIVDWMMPVIDGLELCRRIRREAASAHMYIIMLTSRESRRDVVAGLDAGADDYLSKPFDPDELRARVNVGLRVLALQQRLGERVAELQDALSKVKQLHGLLPICSYCKRIRSDEHYWQQLDSYIAEHSEAQFSHGICPSCFEKVSQEYERSRQPS